MDINSLVNYSIKLQSYMETTKNQLESSLEDKNKILEIINNETKDIKNLEKVQDIFKILDNKLSEANILHVEQLCNNALAAVFNNDKIEYKIKIETIYQRNNNSLQFYLYQHNIIEDTEIKTNIEDNGGGIQSLIGLVLQIYFIIIHNQNHILFIDEGLSAISKDHLDKLKEFLHELCDKLNFKIILIAHDKDLFSLADYTYEVENGEIKEVK